MARDGVARFVHQLADPAGYGRATDRELLGRFAEGRDEGALEALLHRHGRLVWSAASRVLADPNDVDDAIQVTFLVLVRRAQRSDWRADVGPWLYGVAHRVAVRLRARGRRKPGPLGEVDPTAPDARPDSSLREACDLLHAELDRLPEQFRLPLLLCYLEGQTREQAAVALGVSVGTVKGRVRRGCELLRRRLARRGVSLSIGLLGGMAAPGTAGALDPAAVVAALSGAPSRRVAALVREVTRAMGTAKFTLIPIGLVALTGLAYALLPPSAAAPPLAVRAAPAPEPRPAPMFLVLEPSGVAFLDASGAEKERVRTEKGAAISPDGRWVAVGRDGGDPPKPELVIRPRNHKADPITLPLLVDRKASHWDCRPVWAPDGRRVLIGENWITPNQEGFWRYRVFDPQTKGLSELKFKQVEAITDWSRDGKRLLATVRTDLWSRLAWLNADGSGEPEFITRKGEWGHMARLSPDGKRILYRGHPEPRLNPPTRARLYVEDLATGKRTVVDETGVTFGYCWSPDGTRVAYTWQKYPDKKAEVTEWESFLFTCDPDGLNRKTVTSRKVPAPKGVPDRIGLILLDWR
jgi:RNA polymerase sigma factor (sigma-70 family)